MINVWMAFIFLIIFGVYAYSVYNYVKEEQEKKDK